MKQSLPKDHEEPKHFVAAGMTLAVLVAVGFVAGFIVGWMI